MILAYACILLRMLTTLEMMTMMHHKLDQHCQLRTLLITATFILPLALTACDRDSQEETVEKAIVEAAKTQGQDVKINIDGNKTTMEATDETGQTVTFEATENAATITTADGNMSMNSGDAATIPADYPADAVQYQNLKLDLAMVQDSNFMLTGTTADPADAVIRELQTQASSKGWQAGGTFQQESMNMLSFNKGERSMSIMVSADANGTLVNITVSQ